MSDSVQVAIRVRPFNGREKAQNCTIAISMDDGQVNVEVPDTDGEEEKSYKFDYSIWSHSTEASEGGEEFWSQDKVYDVIGQSLLDQLWNDQFNVCLFAYGQSGAGKSFSMTGVRDNPELYGIIPRICSDILGRIEAESTERLKFECTVGMVEIYLNKLHDLLKKKRTKEGLDIQANQVKGLTMLPVSTTEEIMATLAKGQSNQTIAPTGLNPESSRGHTVFTLNLKRITLNPGATKKKDRKVVQTMSMKLIDLAGSEKVEKVREMINDPRFTQEDLDMREKEGRAINTSLTALGATITKVAKASQKATKKERQKALNVIPWRTNKLTHLLRESLSGNCRTVMIAAVSPSSTEFNETISTLRYANQVKQIKTSARKAESGVSKEVKMLMEAQASVAALQAEKDRMMAELEEAKKNAGAGGVDPEFLAEAERKAKEQADALEAMKLEQEEAARAKQEAEEAEAKAEQKAAEMKAQLDALMAEEKARNQQKESPHIVKLYQDANMNGLRFWPINEGKSLYAGAKDAEVELIGSKIEIKHCFFTNQNGTLGINATCNDCRVNGKRVDQSLVELHHNDRIVLGVSNFFRVIVPEVMKSLSLEQRSADDQKYDYAFTKDEATAELMASYQMAEEKRQNEEKEKLEAELKKAREAAAAEEEKLRQEQAAAKAAHEAELKELERKMAEDANAKAKYAAELEAKQKEMAEMLEKQRADMLAQVELEKKKQEELRQQQIREIAQRREDRGVLMQTLTQLLPAVHEANEWCQELKFSTEFKANLKLFTDYSRTSQKVVVEMADILANTKIILSFDEFEEKFAAMRAAYNGWKLNGTEIDFKSSAFQVAEKEENQVGTCMAPIIPYMYNGLDSNEAHDLIGYDVQDAGQIELELGVNGQFLVMEEIKDNYYDMPLCVQKLVNFPTKYRGKNVKVCVTFPNFVETIYDPQPWKGNLEENTKMGATYWSHVVAANGSQVMINWKFTVRLLNIHGKRMKEWLSNEESDLMLKVMSVSYNTTPATNTTGGIGWKKPNEDTLTAMSSFGAMTPRTRMKGLESENEELEEKLQKAEKEKADLRQQLRELEQKVPTSTTTPTPGGDLPTARTRAVEQRVRDELKSQQEQLEKEKQALATENEKLQQQLKEAQENQGSSSCMIL